MRIAPSVYRLRYELDNRGVGVRVPVGARIFTSPRRPHRLCGPPSFLFNWYSSGMEPAIWPRSRTSESRKHQEFSLLSSSRPAMGPTQPIQWVLGALSLVVNRPRREADHSPPTSTEVKKTWIHYPTRLHCIMHNQLCIRATLRLYPHSIKVCIRPLDSTTT
jgi:hypothetical protein